MPLVLDSHNRDSPDDTSSSSARFGLPTSTTDTVYDLTHFMIGADLYNVYSGANKVYWYDGADGSSHSATIASGRYTAATLITALKTALDTAPSTFTVTRDDTTGLLSVETDGGDMKFEWADKTDSIARLLGFKIKDTAQAGTVVSDNVFNPESWPSSIRLDISGASIDTVEAKGSSVGFAIPLGSYDSGSRTFSYNPGSNAQAGKLQSTRLVQTTLRQIDTAGNGFVEIATPGIHWVAQFTPRQIRAEAVKEAIQRGPHYSKPLALYR